ncbi:probable E3 ubiquitin-protein ligase ARI2 [Zingiber officinale]|nr:probable E3 ubiquitin-protein ligase ARI2 [Zingiber officinale]
MADEEDYLSSSDLKDCYLTDHEGVIEENVLQGLEDGREEECHCSLSSVITKESLLATQKEDLRKVMELLALKEQHARTLLIHYRWDVERIFELLDQKGRDRLFSQAGVTVVDNKGLSTSVNPVTCDVCFETVPTDAITEMDCGNTFCNDCWTEHFIVKINDGQSRRIRCMTPKCSAVCDEASIRNLVSARCPDIADCFNRPSALQAVAIRPHRRLRP